MTASERARKLWVIGELNAQFFGVNCSEVKEMLVVPAVAKMPGSPDYVRGMINLRGQVLPLVDLRKRLGMRSAQEQVDELCDLMEQRSQDHVRWLEELKATVKENRPFTLATDPHQCAFGKWYDNFKTDNVLVAAFLKRFDAPHQRVHALAGQVQELLDKSDVDQALKVIEAAEHFEFAAMMKLFRQFQETLRDTHREIAIVIERSYGNYAICVDSIASVEQLAEDYITELENNGVFQSERLTTHVAQRSKTKELVLLLESNAILDSSSRSLLSSTGQTPVV